jgi:hypothetical protein
MTISRTPVPEGIAALILFLNDHTCCICNDSGRTIQIHHIDENPANHDIENLSVLCLECHNETQISGGFGRRYRAPEIRHYKDSWQGRVAKRRNLADKIAAFKQVGKNVHIPTATNKTVAWAAPSQLALHAYVENLPSILQSAYSMAKPGWASVVRGEMIEATFGVTDVVETMWIHLASWFPPNHFGGLPAAQYINAYLGSRRQWHLALHELEGPGSGGREAFIHAAYGALLDAQQAVVDTVRTLMPLDESDSFDEWLGRWKAATKLSEDSQGAS